MDRRADDDPAPARGGRYVLRPNGGQPVPQTYPDARMAIGAASKLGPGRHIIEQPALEVTVTVHVAGEALPVPDAPQRVPPPHAAQSVALPPVPAPPPADVVLEQVARRVFAICRNRGGEQAPAFRTWAEMWRRYCQMQQAARFPGNVVLKFVANHDDFAQMRYGLATALLGDGGFTLVDPGGQVLPWFDEYEARLGEPVEPVPTHSVTLTGTTWMRRYQGGLVLVNTSGSAVDTIAVPAGYRRLNGQQDPDTNNGAPAGDVRLPAQGGLLLVKA